MGRVIRNKKEGREGWLEGKRQEDVPASVPSSIGTSCPAGQGDALLLLLLLLAMAYFVVCVCGEKWMSECGVR